jgi:hypothetical protein
LTYPVRVAYSLLNKGRGTRPTREEPMMTYTMTTAEIDQTTTILRRVADAHIAQGATPAEGLTAAIAQFVEQEPEVAFYYVAALASRKANGVN